MRTTNVILDLGTQPDYIISEINEGDTHCPGGASHLTITDVHLTPQNGQTQVIVRAELQGPVNDDSIKYANAPPHLGRSLDIETSTYQVGGQIRAVSGNDTLTTEETTVVLSDAMATADADEVTLGDEICLVGRTVATIEDIAVYATDNPNQRLVTVEATLNTHTQLGERRFAGGPVRRGQTITLSESSHTLNGRIDRIDAGLERGSADVVLEDVIDVETAERISKGDVATVAGYDTAEIVNVTQYPTQNPDRKRVFVGVSLTTLTHGEREQFGNTPVQRGYGITADFGGYELSGPIERVDALEPQGTVTEQRITLRIIRSRLT